MKSLRLQKTLLAAECMYHLHELETEDTRIKFWLIITKQNDVILRDVEEAVYLKAPEFGGLNFNGSSKYPMHNSVIGNINIIETRCKSTADLAVTIIEEYLEKIFALQEVV